LFHDMGNIYTGLSRLSFRVHQNGLGDFNYMTHAVGFGSLIELRWARCASISLIASIPLRLTD
jgi:hypothetical protein